jgi:hypothetical protein
MSSRQTILGVIATSGFLALGSTALMGYSLDHPNPGQDAIVLNDAPSSNTLKPIFMSEQNSGDRSQGPTYMEPSDSAASSDQGSTQDNQEYPVPRLLEPDNHH